MGDFSLENPFIHSRRRNCGYFSLKWHKDKFLYTKQCRYGSAVYALSSSSMFEMSYVSINNLKMYLRCFPEGVVANVLSYLESDICKVCDLMSMKRVCNYKWCKLKMCKFCVSSHIKCKYCNESYCGVYCFQEHDCVKHYNMYNMDVVDSDTSDDETDCTVS